MVFTPKTVGFALLSLGCAVRQASAATTCAKLTSEVAAITATGTVTLEANFECSTSSISISAAQDITINGDGKTITIAAGFPTDTDAESSLFVNTEGTLTLNDITFESKASGAVRAIWNTGKLFVNDCSFAQGNGAASPLTAGGVIYSESAEDITITSSKFTSNVVTERGGALFADGSETIIITDSIFKENECGTATSEDGAGGDIYAGTAVTLSVTSSYFEGSAAEYGGGAIECCGAIITNSTFIGTEASRSSASYGGAILVGRNDGTAVCTKGLELTEVIFTSCSVDPIGAGGAVAIFDTQATITDSLFQECAGTALLFESSSATGEHQLIMSNVEFNENVNAAEAYATEDLGQGTALVVSNTAVADGGEPVVMGEVNGLYCFANDPYECEVVYDLGTLTYNGEVKCQLCDIDGERQFTDQDQDALDELSDRSTDSGDDSNGLVIGLSLALGLTLVIIGALAAWKYKVRKNARRLMEDMGEDDL